MSKKSFILLNGRSIDSSEAVFRTENRAFRYGDALFESMFASGGSVPLLQDHFDRLKKSAGLIKMIWPQLLTIEILEKEIIRLINKNRIFGGARIRLSLYRDDGGLYTPESNKANYLIEAEALSQTSFTLNTAGLKLEIFDLIKKPLNILSNIKSSSALLYVQAGIYKRENSLDDCFLLNEKGNIIEAISSNVFLVKGKKIYTPAIDTGCVEGVMRKNVIKIAREAGWQVFDNSLIKQDDLLKADEIFLTNAISGIMWVLAYKEKRYYKKISVELLDKMNNEFFSD
ncbi:aminotransferase class IV [Bacteroidota bacterium]